jgi:hypothetical protein
MRHTSRALLGITCVGVLFCSALRAGAADNPPRGGERGASVGLRLGYGKAFGEVVNSTAQSSIIDGMWPFWVDIGYRFNPKLYLGGYFQFAPGTAPSDCQGCSANVIRFGINLHYHFFPGDDYDPWVGIGVGYEILNLSLYPNANSASLRGFEIPNVQLGVDFGATDNVALGPFVTFALAEYTSASGYDLSGTKKLHEWLIFGVRGVFNFPAR